MMKNNQKNKENKKRIIKIKTIERKYAYLNKGITLIALVITIIILLILAGITISAITGDNGLINNTGLAKEETEIANEREIVEKATIQAMGNNKYGNLEESGLQEQLDKETGEGKTEATDIGDVIKVIFIDSNRNYVVDKDGNVRNMTWWETTDEDGNNYVTNGEVTLQIGDYITYNANDNGEYTYTAEAEKTDVSSGEDRTFSSNYETTWRVLGIEHGVDGDNLMIIPATPIQSTESTGLSLRGAIGYCYGIEEIENICEIYGYGTGAISVRSMTIEDMNEITGYDPTNTGDGTVFREGELGEYLNEVICTREENWKTTLQGKNGSTGTFEYSAFVCYDESSKNCKWLAIGESITLTSTFYGYYPTTLTESQTGEIKGISTSSREYSMLFSDNKNYWLASSYILGGGTFTETGCTGLHAVSNGKVSTGRGEYAYGALLYAGNTSLTATCNIMPIVYLDENIELKETGNQVNLCTEWEINV